MDKLTLSSLAAHRPRLGLSSIANGLTFCAACMLKRVNDIYALDPSVRSVDKVFVITSQTGYGKLCRYCNQHVEFENGQADL